MGGKTPSVWSTMSTAVVTTNVETRPASTAPTLRSARCRVGAVAPAESRTWVGFMMLSFRSCRALLALARYVGAHPARSTSPRQFFWRAPAAMPADAAGGSVDAQRVTVSYARVVHLAAS